VKQAAVVLQYIGRARDHGIGVVFITHNPHQAMAVGDRFVVLRRGRVAGYFEAGEVRVEELIRLMSGIPDVPGPHIEHNI
jgi:simple sugar transport system ATP-binding protein